MTNSFLLTANNDKTAQIWNAATGRPMLVLSATNQVSMAAFSPDGKYVLTGSADGTARLWYADYRDDVSYLCGKLLRDFTDEERAAYEIKDTQPTGPKP